MQVVSAGGFNVHCTQGPEAAHNLNMHLPSARVRHLGNNDTQFSMQRYLNLQHVFDALLTEDLDSQTKHTRKSKPGVYNRMSCVTTCHPGVVMASAEYQRSFLHREARVSGGELSDYLCDHFGLPRTRGSHLKMNALQFDFGYKFVREDGRNFWGTDLRYGPGLSRHDMLLLDGLEFGGRDALCCEAICFFKLSRASAFAEYL